MNSFTETNHILKKYSIISISLFAGWLLSVVFEGQVMYDLLKYQKVNVANFNLLIISAHFSGLFLSGFLVKNIFASRMTMISSSIICISGSLIFFLPFTVLWYISIVAISFFSGIFIASWANYYKEYSCPNDRIKTAADVLIYSNLVMIFINVITAIFSGYIGLFVSILILLCNLFFVFRLKTPSSLNINYEERNYKNNNERPIIRPFLTLCLFILIITINSGFMYQVVNPSFSRYAIFTSYYWALPYVVAILLVKKLPARINRAFILYVALTMIGISYVLFMLVDRSLLSFIFINTLMLGAFGICDLFWWSILGGLFEYYNNPVKIFGIGLSMNVIGIFIGSFVGSNINLNVNDYIIVSSLALIVTFIVIIILPILNIQLSKIISTHEFLYNFSNSANKEQKKVTKIGKHIDKLTEREKEIVELLLEGYTYKAISDNLFISQNTMKYHVKNIYQKFNINSKMELIKIFRNIEA